MRRRDVLTEVALTGGLVAVGVGGGWLTFVVHGPGAGLALVWAAAALQVLTAPVVLLRRRRPVLVGVLVAGSAIGQTLLVLAAPRGLPDTFLSVSAWAPIALSVAVEAMTVQGLARRRTAPVWALVAVLTVLSTRPWEPDLGFVINGLLHSAVAPLAGLYLAARRRLVLVLRERAERAEREQLLLAEHARAAERSRLAAEIHDLVAHRVTLVVLRAGALQVNAPDTATREAAEELRVHGCRALDELRELVGVLRRDGTAPAALDERPAPALAELADEAVRAGQPVRLVEHGDASQLSPVVGRTAYRVVQEALTNARKHAWGAPTRVDVDYGRDQVRIAAHTGAAGRGGAGPLPRTGGGTGLTGLRERVELIGGSLTAGPAPGGGFQVETVLPARTGS